MNPIKGQLVEAVMERSFTRETSWTAGTPARIGAQGIDGLYFQTDRNGQITDILIGEAKFGTARLGTTVTSGRQMSEAWIAKHLSHTQKQYALLANEAQHQDISQAYRSPPTGTARLNVPLKDGTAEVWRTPKGIKFKTDSQGVTPAEIKRQLQRTSHSLQSRLEHPEGYRAKVFSYRPQGQQHKFSIEWKDPISGRVLEAQVYQGSFEELPKELQRFLLKELESAFIDMGKSPKEARLMAEHASQHPDYLKTMKREPEWSSEMLKIGLDKQAAIASLVGGAAAVAVSALLQWYHQKELDVRALLGAGASGAIAGLAGYYSSVQIQTMLNTTRIGKKILDALPVRQIGGASTAQALGRLGGGLLASALLAYGGYALGLNDAKSANRMFAASGVGALAGVGATSATFALVGAFGTASTGTAISTLGGAAATNATMAWLGGGSIAAGGGGMALGGVVLTGGVGAVMLAATAVTGYVFKQLDEKERRTVLQGRLQLVTKRIKHQQQAEWATT